MHQRSGGCTDTWRGGADLKNQVLMFKNITDSEQTAAMWKDFAVIKCNHTWFSSSVGSATIAQRVKVPVSYFCLTTRPCICILYMRKTAVFSLCPPFQRYGGPSHLQQSNCLYSIKALPHTCNTRVNMHVCTHLQPQAWACRHKPIVCICKMWTRIRTTGYDMIQRLCKIAYIITCIYLHTKKK